MRYSKLLAALLLWLSLAAPALAQAVVPVQMRDANLNTTITQNFISTQNTFSAPRTLTIPDRSSINSYYLQFIDTANAVNGANTLTIQSIGGNLINGSATYVVSQPGAYVFLTPNGSGYKATAFFNATAPAAPGGSNTQLQYNNAGVFGGISNVTTNGTNIALGTPLSGTLTNTTGFPVANLAGTGTGIVAALATNIGSAGAPILFNGVGGTPSSMIGTNITGLSASNISAGNLAVARLNSGTNASATTFWRGDGAWATPRAPTRQVFFGSASGTYTTNTTASMIKVTLCGATGGGAGSGTGASGGNGGTPAASTFSGGTLSCAGGGGGTGAGVGGAAGVCTGTGDAYPGNAGLPGGTSVASAFMVGSIGGTTPFFATRGGNGGNANGAVNSGAGGGSGGCIVNYIPSPAATYTYSLAAGGTAGTAGTSGTVGFAGIGAVLNVEEF